ncbi:MAG: hypothetical protein ACE5D4_04040, partial [Thermodesulfobacteriota bacterium]
MKSSKSSLFSMNGKYGAGLEISLSINSLLYRNPLTSQPFYLFKRGCQQKYGKNFPQMVEFQR